MRGSDVVHAQDRRSGLWLRLGPRPRPGGLRVYTVHGLPDEFLPIPGTAAAGAAGHARLPRAWTRRSAGARTRSWSRPRRSPSSSLDRLGFPRDKLTVIPHGVDVPERPIQPGIAVGTVALLEPVKGLDVLLRAAARLPSQPPGASLRDHRQRPGGGPPSRRSPRQLGIAESVEFPGYVPKGDALGRLAIFVVSSYLESGPLTLLEAMAAGVPAVATRVGGVPEIATEDTAQLVPAGRRRGAGGGDRSAARRPGAARAPGRGGAGARA